MSAFELDVVQYEAADGPCLTALGGRTVRFGILNETERFPHFAIGAADHYPQRAVDPDSTWRRHHRHPQPVLARSDGFDDEAQRVADITAAEAGTAIITSRIYEQARQRRDELQSAHDEEAQISQAQGALMSLQRCSAEQAIGLLSHAAGRHR